MSTSSISSPITRRILLGGDRWRFAMRGVTLPSARRPRPATHGGSSIRSAWLRLGVERPKLAAPVRGA